jgi:hypothetical protein
MNAKFRRQKISVPVIVPDRTDGPPTHWMGAGRHSVETEHGLRRTLRVHKPFNVTAVAEIHNNGRLQYKVYGEDFGPFWVNASALVSIVSAQP